MFLGDKINRGLWAGSQSIHSSCMLIRLSQVQAVISWPRDQAKEKRLKEQSIEEEKAKGSRKLDRNEK